MPSRSRWSRRLWTCSLSDGSAISPTHMCDFRDSGTHTHTHIRRPWTGYRTTTSGCNCGYGLFLGLQGPAQLPLLSETLPQVPRMGRAGVEGGGRASSSRHLSLCIPYNF